MGAKQLISDDYFGAIHARLLRGRFFDGHDNIDSPPVAIIDRAFARQYFGDEDPLGKHINFSWGGDAWATIVGETGDIKESPASPASPTVLCPLVAEAADYSPFGISLAVRTAYDPGEAADAVRSVIHEIDSAQIIEAVHTMDEVVDSSVSDRRAPLWLFGGFGGIALFLAAIGIYGVLSFYVTQRRAEIGTRMALGAQRGDILRLIMAHAGKLVVSGFAAGLIITLAAVRTLNSLLYGTKPTDGPTLFAVCAVLAIVALLACGIPVFRATHVSSQVILRSE